MSAVRGKNTGPELRLRRIVYGLGYRYRLHRRNLPGTPDLVFPGRRKVVFLHGCFWHQHEGCAAARIPKTRPEFWLEKFSQNKARDERVVASLEAAGWRSLVIWECELAEPDKVASLIMQFLGATGRSS
jgi:DNA mismatch endonuclease (patch repair protein)